MKGKKAQHFPERQIKTKGTPNNLPIRMPSPVINRRWCGGCFKNTITMEHHFFVSLCMTLFLGLVVARNSHGPMTPSTIACCSFMQTV